MRRHQEPKPGSRSVWARAFLAALLLIWSAFADPVYAGLRLSKIYAVRRLVAEELSLRRVPGMTVAIGADLAPAWSQGFGRADLENDLPARSGTVYRIGSISKSITAVAAMQLVERGRLDLDAPIQRYVPSFPRKEWPITARELLSHLSGIRHYRSVAEVNSTRHYTNLLEPLEIFEREPLLFEPGTHFLYSTYGYSLLGAALEAAAGMPFAAYVRENVLLPAHMRCTRIDDVRARVSNRARGYRLAADGRLESCAPFDVSNKIPGGGFVSTADDLVRFASALERGTLVGTAARSKMFAPARTSDGRRVPYGLGWSILERGGIRWVGHSGAQPGVSTYLLVSPSDGVSVAVLANREGLDLGPISVRIAEIVLRSAE